MAYAQVRLDNMAGTTVGTLLRSVKYYAGETPVVTAIQNGMVVKLDGLLTGENEIYKGVVPTAATALSDIVLIATPEVMYDERKHNLDEFINEAGTAARGYKLTSGDIFSVTAEAINGTPVLSGGSAATLIELMADTTLKVVATATSGSTQVGKVIAIDTVGSKTYYVIEVA